MTQTDTESLIQQMNKARRLARGNLLETERFVLTPDDYLRLRNSEYWKAHGYYMVPGTGQGERVFGIPVAEQVGRVSSLECVVKTRGIVEIIARYDIIITDDSLEIVKD